MNITELTLKTHCPREMLEFYVDTLGFALIDESEERFTLDAGDSRLTFEADDSQIFQYHFAFNIPQNQLPDAQLWLMQRIDLLTGADGHTIIPHAGDWDARALYLLDPAGNIVEFVARQRVPTCSDIPFSGQSVLNISEVGLVVDDVSELTAALQTQLELPTFGNGSSNFQALGDDYGLLILVSQGRVWYPTAEMRAHAYPAEVTLTGCATHTLTLDHTPYSFRIMRS